MDVLDAFLNSDEYRQQHADLLANSTPERLVQLLHDKLGGRSLCVVDVGAQALSWEEHIYQPLLTAGLPCEIFGFDPLAQRLRERAEKEKGVTLTLLPYAIGNRQATHTPHQQRRRHLVTLPVKSRSLANLLCAGWLGDGAQRSSRHSSPRRRSSPATCRFSETRYSGLRTTRPRARRGDAVSNRHRAL